MIYISKIKLSFPQKNISVKISITHEDENHNDIKLDDFSNDFSNIYELHIDDDNNMCDIIYNSIIGKYKNYDITIECLINDMYGISKFYKKIDDKLIVINQGNDIKGIIYDDNLSYTVYNINNIPSDLKSKICGTITNTQDQPVNITPTPSPLPMSPVPEPQKPDDTGDKKLDFKGVAGLDSIISDTIKHIDALKPNTSFIDDMQNPNNKMVSTVKTLFDKQVQGN